MSDKDKEKKKEEVVQTAGGCPQPQMPPEFFEEYPGARWDFGGCFWRDSSGNPIGGGAAVQGEATEETADEEVEQGE